MYYLPPLIELPCYIRYSDGTIRDLGEMCGVRSPNSSPAILPAATPGTSPTTQRDSDRDISEAMRIARGTPDFMAGLSTMERVVAYYGRPEKVEKVSDRLPDFITPVAYWWSIRTRRENRVIAQVRVLFTTDERVGRVRLIWQR